MMFGQDVLKTVSGKEYKGKYLKAEGGKVFFIPEGASFPTQVPIESINEIITETGEKISFLSTLIMKDGTVIKGSLTMISIDFIRFLKENETTPIDIQKDDIKSLTGYDGEIDLNNIDVKSPKNSLTLEENQKKLTVKEKSIVVLKTVSGKEYKGKYLKAEGGKVFFIPEGASFPTQVPIESINEIITETGEKISFLSTLIMKDGTVIKGSLTMISIDFIRFLKENETTPIDIQKDDIKSLTGYDGEIDLNNIDVKSPPDFDTLNRLTLEENQKISNKDVIIICCIIVVVLILLGGIGISGFDMSGYDASFGP